MPSRTEICEITSAVLAEGGDHIPGSHNVAIVEHMVILYKVVVLRLAAMCALRCISRRLAPMILPPLKHV